MSRNKIGRQKRIETHYITTACRQLSNNDYELVFLVCAIDTAKTCYEDFIVPFTFFALLHNRRSCVEIVVQSPMAFLGKYGKALDLVGSICGRHFLVRGFKYDIRKYRHWPGTYRFLETPLIKGKYTYIMDIDIMLLEKVVEPYLKNWPEGNVPYNNIIRPDKRRLTGVHFTKTAAYFTPTFKQLLDDQYRKGSGGYWDECLLFDLCQTGHGLVPEAHTFRPIYGIHFSPSRRPGSGLHPKGHSLAHNRTSRSYRDAFIAISRKFPQLFKFRVFRQLMKQLQNEFAIN